MITRSATHTGPLNTRPALTRAAAFLAVCALVSLSAIVTKEAIARSRLSPLAELSSPTENAAVLPASRPIATDADPVDEPAVVPIALAPDPPQSQIPNPKSEISFAASADIRYFNGRPVRPARSLRMTVTAYSPDEKSCGPNARGITSSIHNVGTNAMKLVAADSRILPLGAMVSIPGYDGARIVPVLDRGGAIKGHKLDVLFPTDAQARKWGVQDLTVVVWEYADNLPADDFRAIRDSRK